MSGDSLEEYRQRSLFGMDRSKVVVVIVALVVVAAAGAALVMLSGGEEEIDGETGATLDLVPQDVDGVVYVDGNVTDDEMVQQMLDGGISVGWWLADDGVAPSLDQVFTSLETDSMGYQNVTAFYRGNGSYAGAVAEIEDSSEMVRLAEEEFGSLDETEYGGQTVYRIESFDRPEQTDTGEYTLSEILGQTLGTNTTVWLAPLDDGTVVLGSEQATKDVIDIHGGEAEPLSPDSDLRRAHERAESGPVEATINTTPLRTPELMKVLNEDLATGISLLEGQGSHVDYVSATYTVRNRSLGTVGFDVQVTMREQNGAKNLMELLTSRVENPNEVNNDTPAQIRRVGATKRIKATRGNKYVDIVVPEIPDTIIGYIGNYVDKFGPAIETHGIVPKAADDWETTTPDPNDEALAPLTDVNVTVDTAVTFWQADGEYAATIVTPVPGSGYSAEDIISNRIESAADDEFADQTVAFEHRENTFGYRDVDIFESGLSEETSLTAALSGSQRVVPEWLAVGDENTFIFGTEQAVKDSIDIYRGAAAPKNISASTE